MSSENEDGNEETDRDGVLITQHKQSAACLIDEKTLEGLQTTPSILEGIALGEHAICDGRTVSNEDAKKRFAKWLS